MSNEWFRERLRPEPVDETTPDPDPPVDYDGGARTTPPAPAPSMSTLLRRIRNGGITAGDDDRG